MLQLFRWFFAPVLAEALGVSYFFSNLSPNQHPSLTPQSSILVSGCLFSVWGGSVCLSALCKMRQERIELPTLGL